MPAFWGMWSVDASSWSSSPVEWDWVLVLSSVAVDVSRAKRMGEASRALWAEDSWR